MPTTGSAPPATNYHLAAGSRPLSAARLQAPSPFQRARQDGPSPVSDQPHMSDDSAMATPGAPPLTSFMFNTSSWLCLSFCCLPASGIVPPVAH